MLYHMYTISDGVNNNMKKKLFLKELISCFSFKLFTFYPEREGITNLRIYQY